MLMTAFFADITHGQALARGVLRKNPRDETALFFLGKLDSTTSGCSSAPLGEDRLGRVPGSEASPRRGARQPEARPRARRPRLDRLHRRHQDAVGHALGAGRRQPEGLCARCGRRPPSSRTSTATRSAEFALWDMQVRERQTAEATVPRNGSRRPFPTIGSSRCFWTARRPTSGADAVAGPTPARHRACWRRLARSTTNSTARQQPRSALVGLASAASSSLPAPSGEATRRTGVPAGRRPRCRRARWPRPSCRPGSTRPMARTRVRSRA